MRCFVLLSTSNVQISRVDIKRFLGTTNTLHALNVSYSKHSYVIRVFEFTIFCCPMLRNFAQKATRKRTGIHQKEPALLVYTRWLDSLRRQKRRKNLRIGHFQDAFFLSVRRCKNSDNFSIINRYYTKIVVADVATSQKNLRGISEFYRRPPQGSFTSW